MDICVVLKGGLRTCCSVYPTEFIKDMVEKWFDGVCDSKVIDVDRGEEWKNDKIAKLAIEKFGDASYPMVYINGYLVAIGAIPDRDALVTMIKSGNIVPVTERDIIEAAKNFNSA